MKTLFLAAATVLGLSAAAYADGGAGPTMFTGIEARLANQGRPTAPAVVQGHGTAYVYSTQQNKGTWLFTPNANEGVNN